jgi:hypothetical protein
MKSKQTIASALIFAGAALCFFLPFVTVSCGGVQAFTMTGQQLATGTTLSQPSLYGPPRTQKVEGNAFAAIGWLCALGGVLLSLAGRKMASGTAIAGGAGAVSLLIMRSNLNSQIQAKTQGMATVTYEAGFTVVLLLLLAGMGWNIYLFLQARRLNAAGVPAMKDAEGGLGYGTAPPGVQAQPMDRPGHATVAEASVGIPNPSSGNGGARARFCTSCGSAVRPNARFCESCGSPAESVSVSAPPQPAMEGENA